MRFHIVSVFVVAFLLACDAPDKPLPDKLLPDKLSSIKLISSGLKSPEIGLSVFSRSKSSYMVIGNDDNEKFGSGVTLTLGNNNGLGDIGTCVGSVGLGLDGIIVIGGNGLGPGNVADGLGPGNVT